MRVLVINPIDKRRGLSAGVMARTAAGLAVRGGVGACVVCHADDCGLIPEGLFGANQQAGGMLDGAGSVRLKSLLEPPSDSAAARPLPTAAMKCR